MLDDRWHRSVEAAYGRLNQLGVAVQPHDLQHMRVQLLVASHEGQQGSFTDAAWRAAQNKLAREQQWFSDLTEEQVDPSSEAAQHAVLMLSAAAAEQQTTNQRIENERERFNEETAED